MLGSLLSLIWFSQLEGRREYYLNCFKGRSGKGCNWLQLLSDRAGVYNLALPLSSITRQTLDKLNCWVISYCDPFGHNNFPFSTTTHLNPACVVFWLSVILCVWIQHAYCMWRPVVSIRCSSGRLIYLVFLRQGLSLQLGLVTRQGSRQG